MPAVTIKEIECHRQNPGKGCTGPILKALENITADSIFTYMQNEVFHVKATSKTSMKNELR